MLPDTATDPHPYLDVSCDGFVAPLDAVQVITYLRFRYSSLTFDTAATNRIKDAFEAALVDANGQTLVMPFARGRDAFLNVSEGQSPALAPGVTLSGDQLSVNVSQIPAGTVAKLVIRLVNNDQDTHTGAAVRDLTVATDGATAPVVAVLADSAPSRTT